MALSMMWKKKAAPSESEREEAHRLAQEEQRLKREVRNLELTRHKALLGLFR